MPPLIAIDVAALPPADVSRRAIELSAALPASESLGLRLDDQRLPHITLTQQFVALPDLDTLLQRVGTIVSPAPSLRLVSPGAAKGENSVWIAIERSGPLADLHRLLMDALEPFEQSGGTAEAFVDRDARERDVAWVSEYRRQASFDAFTPHITLGHSSKPPRIDRFEFDATTIAVCQLGRFCTCQRVLRTWTLAA
jgi:hypothetical protein